MDKKITGSGLRILVDFKCHWMPGLLLADVWFQILFVTVLITWLFRWLLHLQECSANWLADAYIYIYTYIYIIIFFTYFFLILLHQVCMRTVCHAECLGISVILRRTWSRPQRRIPLSSWGSVVPFCWACLLIMIGSPSVCIFWLFVSLAGSKGES